MFAVLLPTGITIWHFVVGAAGLALGYWAKQSPSLPATLSQAIAAVVPSATTPVAHVDTVADIVTELESDPAVVAIFQGVLSQLGAQKASAAQALLAAVVAHPNPAVAAPAVGVVAPAAAK